MKLRIRTLVTVALMVLLQTHVAHSVNRIAVVFAPGESSQFTAATYHLHAAQRLSHQLHRSGFAEESVSLLTGDHATLEGLHEAIANATDVLLEGDVLVVAIYSVGFDISGESRVSTCDTKLHTDGTIGGESVDVAELLQHMAVASGARQLLLLDGFGRLEGSPQEAASRFARSLPTPSAGQVVVASRGGRLLERDSHELTAFAWSVLDGLDSHADVNRTGKISAAELTEYISLFAADLGISAPRIAGKFALDTAFFEVKDPEIAPFAGEFNRQAQQLLDEALQALYLELDARASVSLLDRARRLCRNDLLKEVLDGQYLTARVLREGGKVLRKMGSPRDTQWALIASEPLTVYEPGSSNVKAQLSAGSVVRIDRKDGAWLHVSSSANPALVDGTLIFEDLNVGNGFVRTEDLKAAESYVVPSDHLRSQLNGTSSAQNTTLDQ